MDVNIFTCWPNIIRRNIWISSLWNFSDISREFGDFLLLAHNMNEISNVYQTSSLALLQCSNDLFEPDLALQRIGEILDKNINKISANRTKCPNGEPRERKARMFLRNPKIGEEKWLSPLDI